MRVAVDMDDVVLDFCGGLCASINLEYDTSFTTEDITQWDLAPLFGPVLGRGPMSWLRDRHWIWSTFKPVPGALGGIETLRRGGHYLELLTSKPEWAEPAVWDWLRKWRPPFQRVTIVGPDDEKVTFSDSVILVDDKPGNLVEWEKDPGRLGLLFDRPHNRSERRFIRVNNWAEVVREVERVAQEENQ